MKEIDNERRNWLDFVGRVNDRLISRRRSSGVTLWAIVIALAYLGYSIINRISVLSNDYDLLKLLPVSFITASNLFFALIVLLVAYLFNVSSTPKDLRLLSPIRRLSFQNITGITYFLLVCFAALNVFIVLNIYHFDIILWPYIVFAAYLFIQPIVFFLKYINTRRQLKKDYSDAPHISDGQLLFTNTSVKRITIIFSAVVGLALLVVASYSAIILYQSLSLYNYPNIIKLSLELYALTILILLSLGLLAGMQEHQYLEELERKIVIDNMKTEDIRHAFIKEYLGETVRDYVNETEHKLKEYRDIHTQTIAEGNTDLNAITEIDEQYSIEISERRYGICEKIHNSAKGYADYIGKSLSHGEYLIDRFVFDESKDLLEHLIEMWRTHNDEVGKSTNDFCERCRSIHPGIGLDKC